jgi:hypothetical protein
MKAGAAATALALGTVGLLCRVGPAMGGVPARPGEQRPIAVLFTGCPHAGCGYEMARKLGDAGFAVNAAGLEQRPLTWEQVKPHNVLVVAGLGKANADFTLSEANRRNIEVLRRFLAAGGGILFIPTWCQQNALIPTQEAFLAPLGLTPLFDEVIQDNETAVRATAWRIPFAHTENVAPSPVTAGVTSLWYPVDTRAGAQTHTTPLLADANWTVALRGARSSATRAQPIEGIYATATGKGRIARDVPILAHRQVGKGRIVCLGITPEYLYGRHAQTTLEGIVLDRGLRGKPSHGGRLFENALRWLAEPSLGAGVLGGAEMNEALLADPHRTRFGKAFDWARAPGFHAALPACAGLVGARTALSAGSGTVADWVAKARQAKLDWLVFLERFEELSGQELDELKRQCARHTTRDFAAIPGFAIDDEVGNHYFYFGTALPYPRSPFLSKDGKVLVSRDASGPPERHYDKGQLSMTTLDYAYTTCGFKLTAGNYLFGRDAAPFADFFSNWDAMAVVTSRQGRCVEQALADYLRLADSGQGPLPVAIDLMTDPAQIAASPWRTVVRAAAADAGGNPVAAYWDAWRLYPDNPTRIYVTQGPAIENWSFVGPRDYEGRNPGDFVWQNLRWRVVGKVRADDGLREVTVYDGTELFRRFLPGGRKRFEFSLELNHDKQHNLVLVVADAKGRLAVSGEQWDRNHRLEEFHCSDRNNQLTYGYLTSSQGLGLMIGGNQTLATPNKRVGAREISPSGTFRNDALLGAPAFDGAAGGEPTFLAPVELHLAKGAAGAPTVSQCFRLLHSGDLAMGEGRWEHSFTDGVAVKNVWHTMWRTEPARDFTVTQRNTFFNVDPDSPLAAFLWRIRVTMKRDLPSRGLLAGFIRNGEARLWALRGSDGSVRAGAWEDARQSQQRDLSVPFDRGAYAAVLDSPLGGMAVFPLTDGLEVRLALPDRRHNNLRLYLPQARCPQRQGEGAEIALLLLGIPRATAFTKHLPSPTTEVVERFWRDFGLGSGEPAYAIDARAGAVTGRRYVLEIDGSKAACFSGRLTGRLVSTLPIAVSSLNDRCSAFLYDRTLRKARPVGVVERKAWAVVPLRGRADLFLGHPITCDAPELGVQVAQAAEGKWLVELHNPTDRPIRATVRASAFFDPLEGKALPDGPVEVPAGASVVLEL